MGYSCPYQNERGVYLYFILVGARIAHIWQTPVFANMGILPIFDKSQWQTPKTFCKGYPLWLWDPEIEPCDWPKRRHMTNFKASHWSRRLFKFSPASEEGWGLLLGFVTYGEYPNNDKYWSLSHMGYSCPYQNERGMYLYFILVGARITHIWQTPVFGNMGILPIFDKSQWQTPKNIL